MMNPLQDNQISAFLRANPDWLARRPELYSVLEPPQRVHGENVTDHMHAMLNAERRRAVLIASDANQVLELGRAAAGLTERVQNAVLTLLEAPDTAACVADELPAILGVDAATLACEQFRPGWRLLPPGTIAAMLADRAIVLRDRPEDAALLHAEAAMLARRDALIRIPRPAPAMLALVTRDPATLPGGHAGAALGFLGRVLAVLLDR